MPRAFRLATLHLLICSLLWTVLATPADAAQQWRWNDAERIVVVGDVHGAYANLTRLLQATELVDESLNWIGGEAHLVSLGDLLDRGPESRLVMDLMMRLQSEALASGGFVHVVTGNHELMNLIGDLRYVSKAEYLAFAGEETAAMRDAEFEKLRQQSDLADASESIAREDFDAQFPAGFFAHRQAFLMDGRYGKWLTSLPAFVIVNDTAFVHGGLPSLVAAVDPGVLNESYTSSMARFMVLWRELLDDGELPDDQSQEPGDLARAIAAERAVSPKMQEFIALAELPVVSTDGPFWYRGASMCRTLFARPVLDASLANIGANDVVVGHTVTPDRRVHVLHDGKFTMLDTGMLVAYYRGRPAALIIEDDQRVVQYLDPDERQAATIDDFPEAYGLSRSELLDALRNGVVTEFEQSTGRVHLRYQDTDVSAVFFPHNRKHAAEYELAAYALSDTLDFDIVPITVERTFDGKSGAIQLVYSDQISESQRISKQLRLDSWCSMQDQFDLLHVWDTLIANTGRSTDNAIYQEDLWRLESTDHSAAFSRNKKLGRLVTSGQAPLALRPEVSSALAELDQAALLAQLKGMLDKKRVAALISRRDAILQIATQ